MSTTLYWHDYETWGADPRRDRPAQFGGVRTDLELNVISKPLVFYCKPADDMLPHPEACLVTGITPQLALREGVCEAEFMGEIHREFSRPGTCGVGYNSIRFDDEFTRYGLYRNFFDPYGREWQNGNSRWDIIDMVRLTHALRPEGINWPEHEDGTPSFRLEDLTAANNIPHEDGHDALSDVLATIDLARLIRKRQPRLYDYLFDLRDKRKVARQLDLRAPQIVLHVSSMYPASLGCIAPILPLTAHPTNKNGVIVFDLRHDPGPLLDLDVEEIRKRLFTRRDELEDGVERIPLKTVHLNKCPVVVPTSTLTEETARRWQIDLGEAEENSRLLRSVLTLRPKIEDLYGERELAPISDPDQNLYGGGFFSNRDRSLMSDITDMGPERLARTRIQFEDPRLPEMLFRYRARNWPDSLNREEKERWDKFRINRLTNPEEDSGITIDVYRQQLARLVIQPDTDGRKREILSTLADWPAAIGL